jgi:hypothetical protein
MNFKPYTAFLILALICVPGLVRAERIPLNSAVVLASSSANGQEASGAVDGDRFDFTTGHAWKGKPEESNWWWEVHFDKPRQIGAILQISGDHPFVLRHGMTEYVWRSSADGKTWNDLVRVHGEQRTFRLHRLKEGRTASFVRLEINGTEGEFSMLREVEFYSSPADPVPFPDWVVAVNTTDKPALPGEGQQFIPLAKSCPGWEKLQAQQVWVGTFDEAFVRAEPRPICAFLSGNFKDWCEINREPWRGTQTILSHSARAEALPIWASCGGAQGLALLSEVGVDKPWDCPHCRDPLDPKSPIYGHIGHTVPVRKHPCGDYSACIFERGPHVVKRLKEDPAFAGLPEEFRVMESHCGQIEWPPKGWELIVTAGPGTKTKSQCLRLTGQPGEPDVPVYAAQFHIELDGTPETSRTIMGNFLRLARDWKSSGK